MLSFMSAKEAAEKWNISQRRVSVLCSENRINGAMMVGNMWIIPSNAEKPQSKRIKRNGNIRTYQITIEELISEDFEVQANSIQEALRIAEDKYNNGDFVLSPGELVCKQISARDEEGEAVDWYEF